MIINNKSGLTIVMGLKVHRIMDRAFDVLITGGVNQHTYSFERFNTNLKNYVYYALRNNLRNVKDEIVENKVTQPVVIFISAFDHMQDIKELNNIKDLVKDFINDMPVPTHIYMAGTTYELCRGEEVLVSHTGEIKTFDDYEDYRNFMMTLGEDK